MTRLEEIALKEARVRGLMAEMDLDGVLLKKQANFSWFTAGGLNMVGIATEAGVSSILATRTGRYVVANKIESQRMMREESLGELGFELLEHEWYEDREAELVAWIAGDLKRIGSDTGYAGTRDIGAEIARLRYPLTEGEIERYLFLGDRLSAALESVIPRIKPGESECEIAGRLSAELWKDRIDPTGFMVAADERASDYRHPIPTAKKVRKYVMVCVNARYKGLITTVTRLAHFGPPPPALLRQLDDNIEIECRMIAATKPGVPMAEVLRLAKLAYEELGYDGEWKKHHQGGPMGYYGRDIRVTDATRELVHAHQAFCWNPSISGTKSEDGFIATPDGPVMITKPVNYPKVEKAAGGIVLTRPGLLIID